VAARQVAASLVLFVVVYGIIFAAGIYYMNRLINAGPGGEGLEVEGVAGRPIAAGGGLTVEG
jgi:cytochrome d ubiquinol oxidase subunit I